MLKLDISQATSFIPETYLEARLGNLKRAHTWLQDGKGPGCDFTGWVKLPVDYDREEFARIQKASEKIRGQSDVLVVIGIGGSYLGARAVTELLADTPAVKNTPLEIYFAGNGLSADAVSDLIERIGDRDFSVNVVSKSGTTTEPAVAFRIFRGLLEKKYGREAAKDRIYATTDRQKGALKGLADQEGYEEFVVPDDIGGRYSVLTAVGLLPIAAAGIDITELMNGADEMRTVLAKPGAENPAWQYAAVRNALYESGKKIEILASYEPSFRFFGEWWKQLFGESEGKEGKGLFPASVEFTADLHSMGQYIQDGQRILSEAVVYYEKAHREITIPDDAENLDGLNFLSGKSLSYVRDQAMRGTRLAHVDGGVPNVLLTLPERTAFTTGELIYFFEYVCGLSGHLLGVNPFNQPGVEAYKNNMYALLGKPGYQDQKAKLEARLRGSEKG